MAVIKGGGGSCPSPYEIGASELAQAQSDMAKLDQLNTTPDVYKKADSSRGFLDWLFDDPRDDITDAKNQVKEGVALEKSIAQHLSAVAAGVVHHEVSPDLLPEAQSVGDRLKSRLQQDNAAALEGAGVESSLDTEAFDLEINNYHLQNALAQAGTPDVIPLADMPSFKDRVQALDTRIQSAWKTLQNGSTQADREAAKAELVGPDHASLAELYGDIDKQIDLDMPSYGITAGKIDALPDGDALKRDYVQQSKDLTGLVSPGDGKSTPSGVLFNDSALLWNAKIAQTETPPSQHEQ